jgi:hypothetical protein
MWSSSQHDSGPACQYTSSHPTGGGAIVFSTAPPRKTQYKSRRVTVGYTSNIEERCPLLPQPKRKPELEVTCCTLLAILSIIFLLCPLLYIMYPGSSDAVDYQSLYKGAQAQLRRLTQENSALGNEVALYKNLYEDVYVRAEHLEQSNAALEGEIHDLQTKLHDMRGDLSNAKVLAFWEIARTMNTNMCVPSSPPFTLLMTPLRDVWVGADDPGIGPKFWSYGITNGLFNNNDPPVTSTKLHFAADQAAIVESTEHRRIVGYKVESNRGNNGWWIVTGLIEFGQDGSHEVKFSAKPPVFGGAEYDVTIFYADWRL